MLKKNIDGRAFFSFAGFLAAATLSLALVFLPAVAFAAYNDVSLATDTVITVGSDNVTVSGSTASVSSVTVNASNVQITLENGSSVTLTSTSKRDFTPNGGGSSFTSTKTCGDSTSSLALSNSSNTTVVVTVTVDGTCSSGSSTANVDSGSGSVGAGGGGGGGGGGGAAIVPLVTQAILAQQAANQTSQASQSSQTAAAGQVTASVVTRPAVSAVFTRALKLGSENKDVTRLQTLLASDPEIYPSGKITGYFGSITEKAVKKFQEKYGIAGPGEAGYGAVGPKTREKLNEVFNGAANVPAGVPAAATIAAPSEQTTGAATFTKALKKGGRHSEVKLLQEVLNKDPETMIAETGIGSLGNETDYFGSLTEKAVQRFQEKYGIAKAGETGYGSVGPKTRAKLSEIAGQGQ